MQNVAATSLEGETIELPLIERERDHLRLKALETMDWRLRFISLFIVIILTFAVVALTIRVLSFEANVPFKEDLERAMKGLVAVVLLFSIHTFYQQISLFKLRKRLVEQRAKAGDLELLTLMDPLTGLYNRRMADLRLGEEIERSKRTKHSLTVLCLDLDGFKQINDMYGHSTGDLALKEFAGRLQKSIRNSDVPIRLGGDEFIVLLPECLTTQVNRILERLSSLHINVQGREVAIRVSAGSAVYLPDESATEFLGRADKDLYLNKTSRKLKSSVVTA